MRSALVGFCIGIISVAWLPLTLKMLGATGISLSLIYFALFAYSKNNLIRKSVHLVSGLLLGLAYAVGVGAYNLQHRLNDCGTNELISVSVRINSAPIENGDRQSFAAEVLSTPVLQSGARNNTGECASLFRLRNLRLNWYKGPQVLQNQVWRVNVKPRAPRGFQNPGGFDYEAWMFRSRFDATGIIKSGTLLKRPKPNRGLESARQQARKFFLQTSISQGAVMLALVTGDSQAISKMQWALFQATGTIHLVVISGLHVGLIGTLGFMSGQFLARLFPPLLRRTSARLPGVFTGLLCSYIYCELSGWNVPAQRAFVTLAIVASLYLLNRHLHSGNSLLVVIACLLFLDPLSPLVIGFWLSFGAVAVLLFYFVPHKSFGNNTHKQSRIAHYLRTPILMVAGLSKMQAVLFVGMLPLFWIWLGQISWVAPLANLLAVPVISWLVVPGAMASFILSATGLALSGSLQMLTNNILGFLFAFLQSLEQWASLLNMGFNQAGAMDRIGLLGWVVTAFSSAIWLLPFKLRIRLLLLGGLFIPFIGRGSGIDNGQFKLTVLDVGQGSAYLIETANRRLLYDTAAFTRTGFDFGESIVVPALLQSGLRQLDVVVLSHADIDHVGGFDAVSRRLDIGMKYYGSPMPDLEGERCSAGQTWEWDGVFFKFLHPSRVLAKVRNDQSCVLLVKNTSHSVLLTGDVSKKVELKILAQLEPLSVLVVAHHGSDTSSSIDFLEKLQPVLSIISAGYSNRYKHPHPAVIARLKMFSHEILVTADAGAITWDSTKPDRLFSARSLPAPYWRVRVP